MKTKWIKFKVENGLYKEWKKFKGKSTWRMFIAVLILGRWARSWRRRWGLK